MALREKTMLSDVLRMTFPLGVASDQKLCVSPQAALLDREEVNPALWLRGHKASGTV